MGKRIHKNSDMLQLSLSAVNDFGSLTLFPADRFRQSPKFASIAIVSKEPSSCTCAKKHDNTSSYIILSEKMPHGRFGMGKWHSGNTER